MAHTNSDLESLPPQVRVPKAQNRYQAGRPSPNPRPPNILQAHDLLSASLQMPSAAWQEWNSEKDAYKPVLFFLPSLIHTRTSHKRVLLAQNYTHPRPTPGTPKHRDQELHPQLLGKLEDSWGGPGTPGPFCHLLTSPSSPQPRLSWPFPTSPFLDTGPSRSLGPRTSSLLKGQRGSRGRMVQGPQVPLSRQAGL